MGITIGRALFGECSCTRGEAGHGSPYTKGCHGQGWGIGGSKGRGASDAMGHNSVIVMQSSQKYCKIPLIGLGVGAPESKS